MPLNTAQKDCLNAILDLNLNFSADPNRFKQQVKRLKELAEAECSHPSHPYFMLDQYIQDPCLHFPYLEFMNSELLTIEDVKHHIIWHIDEKVRSAANDLQISLDMLAWDAADLTDARFDYTESEIWFESVDTGTDHPFSIDYKDTIYTAKLLPNLPAIDMRIRIELPHTPTETRDVFVALLGEKTAAGKVVAEKFDQPVDAFDLIMEKIMPHAEEKAEKIAAEYAFKQLNVTIHAFDKVVSHQLRKILTNQFYFSMLSNDKSDINWEKLSRLTANECDLLLEDKIIDLVDENNFSIEEALQKLPKMLHELHGDTLTKLLLNRKTSLTDINLLTKEVKTMIGNEPYLDIWLNAGIVSINDIVTNQVDTIDDLLSVIFATRLIAVSMNTPHVIVGKEDTISHIDSEMYIMAQYHGLNAEKLKKAALGILLGEIQRNLENAITSETNPSAAKLYTDLIKQFPGNKNETATRTLAKLVDMAEKNAQSIPIFEHYEKSPRLFKATIEKSPLDGVRNLCQMILAFEPLMPEQMQLRAYNR